MENRFLDSFLDIVVLKVKTRNIDRFLNNLYKLNIDIFRVDLISFNEVIVEILNKDIKSIKKISILNKIEIIDYKGRLKRKNKLVFNKTLLFSIFLGFVLLIFLTNIIFSIEVVHSSTKLRDFIMSELNKNKIHRLQLRKSFHELERIKNKILDDNKDKIEWLEIERVGTKYIVKVEERRINNISTDYKIQDIVANRDGVVKKIIAENGVKMVEVNDYVKKGDILISGNIYLNEELKNSIKAIGNVYAEVWYKLDIEYPLIDNSKTETGNKYVTYSFNFMSNRFSLKKDKYINYYINKKNILWNNVLPISITKDTVYELEASNGPYFEGESVLNAREYARGKIKDILKNDEYIISEKVLKYNLNSNTIYMSIFYKVYENIAETKEIINEGSE